MLAGVSPSWMLRIAQPLRTRFVTRVTPGGADDPTGAGRNAFDDVATRAVDVEPDDHG